MSQHRRNTIFLSALFVTSIVMSASAAAGSPAAVHIGHDAPILSSSDENAVGDQISILADEIYKLADENFVDIHTDAANRSIHLFWKGAPSGQVLNFISENQSAIFIDINSDVAISRKERDLAVEDLLEIGRENSWDIQSLSMNPIESSVSMAVGPDSKFQDSSVGQIKEVANVGKVLITRNSIKDFSLSGRLSDVSPFKGGARTVQWTTGGWEVCSTGFSVLSGSYGRLLSSRHCDPSSNNSVYNGDFSVTIAPGGASISGQPSLDSQLIDPDASPATTPRIFYGSWASNTTLWVQSWATNWVGDSVCLSGATSGNRCGTVTDDSVTWVYGGYNINTILVSGSSTTILAASGDSGGPAYHLLSTGKAQARGIISSLNPASAYHTKCDAYGLNPDSSNPKCSNQVLYVPISTLLSAWNVALEVN